MSQSSTHSVEQQCRKDKEKRFQQKVSWCTFVFSSPAAVDFFCDNSLSHCINASTDSVFLSLALEHQCQIALTDCLLLNQRLTERRNEGTTLLPKASSFKTMQLFSCEALQIEMSCQHSCSHLSLTACRMFTDDCMLLSSDRNQFSRLFLFRCRRREERFSEGPPFRRARRRQSCSLAARRVVASTLLVAIAMRHIFDQSLLRIGSTEQKTLKRVMLQKSLLLFMTLYPGGALCPWESLSLLDVRRTI